MKNKQPTMTPAEAMTLARAILVRHLPDARMPDCGDSFYLSAEIRRGFALEAHLYVRLSRTFKETDAAPKSTYAIETEIGTCGTTYSPAAMPALLAILTATAAAASEITYRLGEETIGEK